MCGIAGIIDLSGSRQLPLDGLKRMVDALYLRGPDDEGTAVHPPVAMGMRRLSIIDLEGGHQPIENEDGSVRVVVNGELYSFPELREELLERGHRFTTRSDTEVLVHGYEEWGIQGLLDRLNGMFAFALQDDRNRVLYIARDRLGIKPLLFTEVDGYLLFSSSISSLVASGIVPVEPDPLGLRLYLHNQFIPGPHSALCGVRKLPPASYLEIRHGVVSAPVVYWSIPNQLEPDQTKTDRSYEDWCGELSALLEDAVRVHMVSDVEVGLFLSGGLDSTTMLALMSRHAKGTVKAFSIGFEDKRIYDESPFAAEAARRFGAELHHTVFTPNHVVDLAQDLIRHIDEPLGDAACLPTFLLSRDARRLVKVVLSGEGADELFAGYEYYKHLPPRNPGGRNNLRLNSGRGLLSRLFRGGARSGIDLSTGFSHKSPLSGFPYAIGPQFADLLLRELPLEGGAERISAEIRELEESWLSRSGGGSDLSNALRVDTSGWLPDDLLVKVDRMTMAHSLEARVPFLDYRVVELAFRMPDPVKIRRGEGKAVLRDAVESKLGESLTRREKHGFDLPMHQWVRRELAPLIHDTLGATGRDALAWISKEATTALLDAHMFGRGNLERPIWTLFVLAAWFAELAESRSHAVA